MKGDKKPDNVVFNTEKETYDAALRPYGTNLGAPQITTTDTTLWKNRGIQKVNHAMKATYNELKAQYDKMMETYEYNHLIFSAKFSFEPIVGHTYHLYKRDNGEAFLSLIAPTECNFNFIGSFYLNADIIWEKVD